MINFNRNIVEEAVINQNNRGFKFGDAVFETLKVIDGKILFFEDHYFRLMASMRIMRMEIPMVYTMENIEFEIKKLIKRKDLLQSAVRVRLTVYRDAEGLYLPKSNDVGFVIEASALPDRNYILNDTTYEVGLFKDHYITPQLLSTLKTNNRILNVIASVYAQENSLSNCLLLNSDKKVVEAINGNLFLVKGNVVKTPLLSDGCIKGIMRKQIIELLTVKENITIEEASISPFELQQADELFISNVIKGVVSISKYRKKEYSNSLATDLVKRLNAKILLG
ncbi:aminotransferase class IV [Pseudofulvibacter geojedonensis]|uniref:branched-chain-amino-acid transaminase n=1 Tax=Pseudofulvibacter geojedonensis TaxID=1123758 RepID=A0ABW3HZ91_9FLAO